MVGVETIGRLINCTQVRQSSSPPATHHVFVPPIIVQDNLRPRFFHSFHASLGPYPIFDNNENIFRHCSDYMSGRNSRRRPITVFVVPRAIGPASY